MNSEFDSYSLFVIIRAYSRLKKIGENKGKRMIV